MLSVLVTKGKPAHGACFAPTRRQRDEETDVALTPPPLSKAQEGHLLDLLTRELRAARAEALAGGRTPGELAASVDERRALLDEEVDPGAPGPVLSPRR